MGFEDRDRPGKGLFKTIREIAAVDLSIKFRLRSGETVELLTEGMAIEGETITGKLFGTKNETSLQINDIMDIEPDPKVKEPIETKDIDAQIAKIRPRE